MVDTELVTELAETNLKFGLSDSEASQRLNIAGPNEILSSRLKSRLSELIKLLLDPMSLMLLGLSGLYLILGDRSDSVILLVAWSPVTAVDVVLELRAVAPLKALKANLNPFAKILRQGTVRDVSIREIVPGDLVVFEEGQVLPVDGRIVEADNLIRNESALTGESVPVEKSQTDPFFSGTQISSSINFVLAK